MVRAKDTKKFKYANKPKDFVKSTGVKVGNIKISVGDARKILTHYNAKMEIQGRIWLMRGSELEKELKNFIPVKKGTKYIFKHRSNRRYTSPAYHLRGMTDAKETKGYEKAAIKMAKEEDKKAKKAYKEAMKKKKAAAKNKKIKAGTKGAKSKTHKGDKDYTTKAGDKVYHQKGKDVKKKKKPFSAADENVKMRKWLDTGNRRAATIKKEMDKAKYKSTKKLLERALKKKQKK
jgi:hypothetical protein